MLSFIVVIIGCSDGQGALMRCSQGKNLGPSGKACSCLGGVLFGSCPGPVALAEPFLLHALQPPSR